MLIRFSGPLSIAYAFVYKVFFSKLHFFDHHLHWWPYLSRNHISHKEVFPKLYFVVAVVVFLLFNLPKKIHFFSPAYLANYAVVDKVASLRKNKFGEAEEVSVVFRLEKIVVVDI